MPTLQLESDVTYCETVVDGQKVFYRDAGPKDARVIVLLHGFPSSSHMYRDLIPKLSHRFRVIAPDYIGFGYSDAPPVDKFTYTFDRLTSIVEQLLFDELGLKKFSIYVQDYGAPVGFRIASRHPGAIEAIIVQNGNAYMEGLSPALEPLKAFWVNRNPQTEAPIRSFLTPEAVREQYVHGSRNPQRINPDSYGFDQALLARPGNHAIQLELLHNYQSNLPLYSEWHAYFRKHQPPTLIVWGKNDFLFTVEGAKAYLRDLPKAELHLLDAGHFALEEESETIAQHIIRFREALQS